MNIATKADTDERSALLIADLDGTLLAPGNVPRRRAKTAVRRLSPVAIGFTLVSQRPPWDLAGLVSGLILARRLARLAAS